MKKNSPLMLEFVSKLYALTCIWQGEVKYHIKQAKQNSNNMKKTSMATQENNKGWATRYLKCERNSIV